jgi:hypothetical protein
MRVSLVVCALFAFGCGDHPSQSKDAAGGGDLSVGDGLDGGAGGSQLSLLTGAIGGFGTADGTGANARFRNPGGVAFDGADTLYVADTESHSIRKITISTGAVTTLAGQPGNDPGTENGDPTQARFSSISGIVIDPGENRLLVSEFDTCTIRAIDLATRMVSTLAGSAFDCQSINGPLDVPTIADAGADVDAGDVDAGAPPVPAARFLNLEALWIDSTGRNLFAVEYESFQKSNIRKLSLIDSTVDTYVVISDGDNHVVNGIAGDNAGKLYLADSTNQIIYQIAPPVAANGQPTISTVAGQSQTAGNDDGPAATATFAAPRGVLVVDSTLFVIQAGSIDSGNPIAAAVRAIDLNSLQVSHVTSGSVAGAGAVDGPAQSASFDSPSAIAGDAHRLFIADSNNHAVRQVSIDSNRVATLAGRAGGSGLTDGTLDQARFDGITAIAIDSVGRAFT